MTKKPVAYKYETTRPPAATELTPVAGGFQLPLFYMLRATGQVVITALRGSEVPPAGTPATDTTGSTTPEV